MRKLVWLLAFVGVAFGATGAQGNGTGGVPTPDPVLEHWRWQVFTARDGVASVRVRDFAQSEDAIWLATDQGVSRYDGMAWQTYTTDDGLPSDEVHAVMAGADGSVWFGTASGAARFDGDVWQSFGEAEGLPGLDVRDLLLARRGEIWAATENGAAVYNGSEWRPVMSSDGLADDDVNGLALGADGAIWFATERGASSFDGVSWQSYRRGDELHGTSVTSVFADRDGGIWFAQYGIGIAHLHDGVWRHFGIREGLPDLQVRRVFQTLDGVIWLICRSGIARLDATGQGEETWVGYPRRVLPGLGEPKTAGVDAKGAIWIGGPSSRGVARFDYTGRRLSVYHVGRVADLGRGGGIGQDRDGAIWIGTGSGAMRFDGETWTSVPDLDGPVTGIFCDGEDMFIMGRDRKGPAVFSVHGMRRQALRHGLKGETVTALARTRNGTLWAGVPGGGIFRWNERDETWVKQRILVRDAKGRETREIHPRVLAMAPSQDGTLRISGKGRLLGSLSAGGMWKGMTVHKHGDVPALVATSDGSLWMGRGMTGGGAICLNAEGKVTEFTVRQGLAHDEVHAFVEDANGHLWAGTSGGLSRFDGTRWVTVRDLPDMDVRALFVARDGAVWVRTADGDVVRYWNDGEAPRTFIESPSAHVPSDGNVNFVWEGRDRWYSKAIDLEYSYRLDGGEWQPFSNRHGVSLFSLADGEHTLEVQARDVDLNVEARSVVHTFVVDPPLWKQVWFIALVSIMLAIIGMQTRRILVRDAALASANARLEELDQLKTDFFSNVSHELRTPLTAIKGYVDNMLDGIAGEVTDRQTRYLTRVKSNADRLADLINDLLDLSRLDRGRTDLLQMNIEPLPVQDVVHQAVEDLRSHPEAEGLKLSFSGEDATAMADRSRLMQMVTNLAGNAIKFTASGGEVNVSVRNDGTGFVQVVVKDTGKGIPAADLDKIFDRFHQVQGTTGGTGLGLPITKELVELQGGQIWAESEEGVGSTFTFTLPEPKG